LPASSDWSMRDTGARRPAPARVRSP